MGMANIPTIFQIYKYYGFRNIFIYLPVWHILGGGAGTAPSPGPLIIYGRYATYMKRIRNQQYLYFRNTFSNISSTLQANNVRLAYVQAPTYGGLMVDTQPSSTAL